MIVNAGSDVLHTIIGTIMSIVSKSGDFEDGFYLMGLARNPDDGLTKVSLRVTGNDPSIDLKSIVVDLVGVTGGEAGGHQFACGANIPVDVEDEFIRLAEKRFGELCVLK